MITLFLSYHVVLLRWLQSEEMSKEKFGSERGTDNIGIGWDETLCRHADRCAAKLAYSPDTGFR